MRLATYALLGTVVVAAGLAVYRPDRSPQAATVMQPSNGGGQVAVVPPQEDEQELPPNHPPVGAGATAAGPNHGGPGAMGPNHGGNNGGVAPSDEPAGMVWKMPSAWKVAPNPNAMRIATYRVPGATPADDADVSISRAGGSLDMNIERWVGQFQGAGKETRTERMVHGIRVTLVEIHGAYVAGGMGGGSSEPRAGWAMLAAIVETQGMPYFVKMVGPDATVKAARPALDELVASIVPAQ